MWQINLKYDSKDFNENISKAQDLCSETPNILESVKKETLKTKTENSEVSYIPILKPTSFRGALRECSKLGPRCELANFNSQYQYEKILESLKHTNVNEIFLNLYTEQGSLLYNKSSGTTVFSGNDFLNNKIVQLQTCPRPFRLWVHRGTAVCLAPIVDKTSQERTFTHDAAEVQCHKLKGTLWNPTFQLRGFIIDYLSKYYTLPQGYFLQGLYTANSKLPVDACPESTMEPGHKYRAAYDFGKNCIQFQEYEHSRAGALCYFDGVTNVQLSDPNFEQRLRLDFADKQGALRYNVKLDSYTLYDFNFPANAICICLDNLHKFGLDEIYRTALVQSLDTSIAVVQHRCSADFATMLQSPYIRLFTNITYQPSTVTLSDDVIDYQGNNTVNIGLNQLQNISSVDIYVASDTESLFRDKRGAGTFVGALFRTGMRPLIKLGTKTANAGRRGGIAVKNYVNKSPNLKKLVAVAPHVHKGLSTVAYAGTVGLLGHQLYQLVNSENPEEDPELDYILADEYLEEQRRALLDQLQTTSFDRLDEDSKDLLQYALYYKERSKRGLRENTHIARVDDALNVNTKLLAIDSLTQEILAKFHLQMDHLSFQYRDIDSLTKSILFKTFSHPEVRRHIELAKQNLHHDYKFINDNLFSLFRNSQTEMSINGTELIFTIAVPIARTRDVLLVYKADPLPYRLPDGRVVLPIFETPFLGTDLDLSYYALLKVEDLLSCQIGNTYICSVLNMLKATTNTCLYAHFMLSETRSAVCKFKDISNANYFILDNNYTLHYTTAEPLDAHFKCDQKHAAAKLQYTKRLMGLGTLQLNNSCSVEAQGFFAHNPRSIKNMQEVSSVIRTKRQSSEVPVKSFIETYLPTYGQTIETVKGIKDKVLTPWQRFKTFIIISIIICASICLLCIICQVKPFRFLSSLYSYFKSRNDQNAGNNNETETSSGRGSAAVPGTDQNNVNQYLMVQSSNNTNGISLLGNVLGNQTETTYDLFSENDTSSSEPTVLRSKSVKGRYHKKSLIPMSSTDSSAPGCSTPVEPPFPLRVGAGPGHSGGEMVCGPFGAEAPGKITIAAAQTGSGGRSGAVETRRCGAWKDNNRGSPADGVSHTHTHTNINELKPRLDLPHLQSNQLTVLVKKGNDNLGIGNAISTETDSEEVATSLSWQSTPSEFTPSNRHPVQIGYTPPIPQLGTNRYLMNKTGESVVCFQTGNSFTNNDMQGAPISTNSSMSSSKMLKPRPTPRSSPYPTSIPNAHKPTSHSTTSRATSTDSLDIIRDVETGTSAKLPSTDGSL